MSPVLTNVFRQLWGIGTLGDMSLLRLRASSQRSAFPLSASSELLLFGDALEIFGRALETIHRLFIAIDKQLSHDFVSALRGPDLTSAAFPF